MAEKNNATCSICGNGYYMCLSCKDSVKANPWKMHTDTAEHYKVYQVIHGVSTGVYNKDEAKSKFKNIDLSDLNTFRPHIKKIIKDILKEEPVEKVAKLVETKNAIVEDDLVVENVEIAQKVGDVEKQIMPRKKNYKVEAE